MKFLFPLFLVIILFVGCDKDTGCDPELNLNVDQAQLNSDIDSINVYLDENNISTQVHPSGLRYIINEEGIGINPGICDIVTFTYTSKLLSNESVVEDSVSGIGFELSKLIKGFQIGLPLIKDGGSMTLYIPSGYGYEDIKNSPFPSDANLIVDIGLTEVE